jgi:hypothetical protein
MGRVFEVTSDGRIVWDYLNPFTGEVTENMVPWMPVTRDALRREEHRYSLARATRVAKDHPGLARLAKTGVK